jgi:hypothetical protein
MKKRILQSFRHAFSVHHNDTKAGWIAWGILVVATIVITKIIIFIKDNT